MSVPVPSLFIAVIMKERELAALRHRESVLQQELQAQTNELESARRKGEEEARMKAEEEARMKAAEEARRKAEAAASLPASNTGSRAWCRTGGCTRRARR